MLIHYCDWSQQPDIRIACTTLWTQPTWGEQGLIELPAGVYLSDDDDYYTFDAETVTCPQCAYIARETR